MNPKSPKETGRNPLHKANEPAIEEEIWKKPTTETYQLPFVKLHKSLSKSKR
jgi:hypothetical protein